jgi:hypothetical protein
LKGKFNEQEKVYKVSSPRADVKVSVDQWKMPPFMGVTSWAAFTAGKESEAMVMGDLVLFQDEVNPVMSAALNNGLQVTALHNHFFFDNPKVYFMHIGGEGDSAKLAKGVRAALDTVKSIRSQNVTRAESDSWMLLNSRHQTNTSQSQRSRLQQERGLDSSALSSRSFLWLFHIVEINHRKSEFSTWESETNTRRPDWPGHDVP